MFSTSADILNLVLSVCTIALVFFLCWALYYFIVSIKDFYRLIKRVENGVAKAEEIITIAKDKIRNSGVYLTMFGEIAKRIMEFAAEKKQERAARKGTKTTGKK